VGEYDGEEGEGKAGDEFHALSTESRNELSQKKTALRTKIRRAV
jgi:hypothetical protein